jgi:hypothetical protein
MRKLATIALFFLVISSCVLNEKKSNCDKFKEKLEYLRKYSIDEKNTYNLSEIEDKIEFLENQSGIKNKDQGNLIGKFIVTKEDIIHWEKWLNEKCNKVKP